ncbi:hypothetical protein PHYBLDRAFT_58540 [Phycomyces blakesleeanus NRRL 1555(-)]|uniref:Uncharacterized protein n=1 Tax=Phycomyces blakesleeanus (strain ATCC 8743b / DSM 1359 / FGSC 10004 / NBRC 33097 / NRRL 1555) TaxID=763407 RepID=A0A162V2C7_PHYB8|nr:hypothetical protein PHYBLDRAFT_58540 [Phycomyces blakesleeanus NRRL 1555(-)]OAD79492.1 hypothetical protein PHYBLDRAFT_58540 [Phycomyces blakesleeanus NRRL 1555(-)]|eukprot:XP_018297532.1 hypothetical protein PHYBLDRAFT_58540 [Phycomyces blakesleeanus NRRL 1555(-)]
MPPASKKSRLAKSKFQSESGNCFSKNIETSNDDLVDLFEIDIEEDITVDDRELQRITDDVTSAIYSSHFLKWHEGADKFLRGTYQKNSLTIEWRKRKTMKESFDSKGSYLLTLQEKKRVCQGFTGGLLRRLPRDWVINHFNWIKNIFFNKYSYKQVFYWLLE